MSDHSDRTRADAVEFRALGHAAIDALADYLETIEARPVAPTIDPGALDALFDEPLPREPADPTDVLDETLGRVLPYSTHVGHPGYLGLLTPSPTPIGAVGDLIASTINQNPGIYTVGPAAVAIERRTVRWLADIVGFGDGAGGTLTSGGMMAIFIGLKLARDWASGDMAQRDGVTGRWAVYASEERHVSFDKAVDAIGVGRSALRLIPTSDDASIRINTLEAAIAQDRRDGVRPMCIVGMFGTTNLGAVDDLHALRAIADREGAWLHVDAAYGGGMLLSQRRPMRDAGLELADSVSLDPHKWFYTPLDAGALLVRQESRLTASFGMRPAYIADRLHAEVAGYDYFVHSFEQSRRFRALKVWMTFKRYGVATIGEWIDRNIAQAEHLYELVQSHPDFEAATRPAMSAVCLRYCAGDMSASDRARLHVEVARRVAASGRFWISTTSFKGKAWFRVNPVNFRTRMEDMDGLLELLARECAAGE